MALRAARNICHIYTVVVLKRRYEAFDAFYDIIISPMINDFSCVAVGEKCLQYQENVAKHSPGFMMTLISRTKSGRTDFLRATITMAMNPLASIAATPGRRRFGEDGAYR